MPSDATFNELQDALAHSEANRLRAVEEAIAHGTAHLEQREKDHAARAAATRAEADADTTGG